MSLNLSYPAIISLFGDYKLKGRTESQAFLAWFLQNYYRLEASEVDDSICDETGDNGIDGIYVSELFQQIDVFQSRMGTRTQLRSLGDNDLKVFQGSLTQLKDSASVQQLVKTTGSPNLRKLLERLEVARLVDEGYEVRGIFLTNRPRDKATTDFLAQSSNLYLYDEQELRRQYLPIDKPEPIATEATFDVSSVNTLWHTIEPGVEMIIAPLLASDLVKMGGLANQELFAWNLRYQLRRSPVNKEIEKSISNVSEHKYFPAFHNGLTVLAEGLTVDKDVIKIRGYAVVNGCQSLSALYQRYYDITPDLRILTKFVSVSPKSDLAQKITDHTNRQNGITGRDLQSNNPLQTRLQSDIHTKYNGVVFYRIARGERSEWDASKTIENDAAARMLLAFDLKQPEVCHQHYRLFDDLHAPIFGRPEVNADRIVALMDIDHAITTELPNMENKLFGGYSLTRFLFHYLVREILELPESRGLDFCKNPSFLMGEPRGRARLRYCVKQIVLNIMDIISATYLKPLEGNLEFDYKKDLKNQTKIQEIRTKVIPFYQMAIRSKLANPFVKMWAESEKELLPQI